MFTEIVICKCCGLDQFTVKEIQKRAVDDKEIICQLDEKPLLKNEIIKINELFSIISLFDFYCIQSN